MIIAKGNEEAKNKLVGKIFEIFVMKLIWIG